MEYVLVFIRIAFYFLAMLLFLFYKLGYKPGFLHPRIRPLYFWTMQFYQHMKRSDNARKFFIFMVIILLTIAQAVDLSLVTDYGFMKHDAYSAYIQFGLGMILTIALFRYSLSDRILSRKCGLMIDYWGVLLTIAILALLELFILQDVLYVIFLARCVYPKKEVDDDPKGRESIHDDDFKIISFRKAAILFFCLKLMAV